MAAPCLFEASGPTWGPCADSTVLALALRARYEVIHRGAGIALLGDLYRALVSNRLTR